MSIPTTPRPPPARPAASPTSSSWATPTAPSRRCAPSRRRNGKVGVIGYCSGGRHSFLTAVSLPVDAAVDCYGAFVTGTVPDGFPLKVTPLVDRTPELKCPLLGLFGNDDQFPSPEQVDELEAALKAAGKDVRVPPLRRRRPCVLLGRAHGVPARGRRRRLAAHLRVLRHAPGGPDHVLLPHRRHRRSPAAPRGRRAGSASPRPTSTSTIPSTRPSTTRSTSTSPTRPAGPGARVAVELSAESARRLVASINEALAAAGAAAS